MQAPDTARLRLTRLCPLLSSVLVLLLASSASAVPVGLQNATATFSQSGFPVTTTTDGVLSGGVGSGWAIRELPNNTSEEVAVWETATDLTAAILEIQLIQN